MSKKIKPRRRISYDKDFHEFIPCSSQARSCAKTLTDTSVEEENRPLDEIALLKRGYIERESYNRRMRKEPEPLTKEEVFQRGIQLSNGQIVYAFNSSESSSSGSSNDSFQSTQKATSNASSNSSSKSSSKAYSMSSAPPAPTRPRTFSSKPVDSPVSSGSYNSTITIRSQTSEYDLFEKALSETVYDVGLPEEKATLKMCDTNTGKRYELGTPDGQIVLQNTARSKFLLITKDSN